MGERSGSSDQCVSFSLNDAGSVLLPAYFFQKSLGQLFPFTHSPYRWCASSRQHRLIIPLILIIIAGFDNASSFWLYVPLPVPVMCSTPHISTDDNIYSARTCVRDTLNSTPLHTFLRAKMLFSLHLCPL